MNTSISQALSNDYNHLEGKEDESNCVPCVTLGGGHATPSNKVSNCLVTQPKE